MALDKTVSRVLRSVGDAGGALVWQRTCRELGGGPRLGVAALSSGAAVRAMEALRERAPGVGPVALGYDPGEAEEDDAFEAPPTVREALLGVHGVVWATRAAQPLGARERRALQAIEAALAPSLRVVLLTDPHVLERVSDDPQAELADVVARVEALVAPGWRVVVADDTDAIETLEGELRAELAALREDRKETVARLLLADAREALDDAETREAASVARHEAALASEDEALDRARAAGVRAAAHTLGVLRRRTEEVVLDLRAFLRDLEADLPDQIAAMGDVEKARRTVPHWLEHVVQGWLHDRLAAWRAQVHADLKHVRVADEALAHAELLLPALHPPPIPSQGRWRRALGLTAGLGGAAALAFISWPAALFAAAGGVAWSVLDREGAGVRQDRLIDAAVEAVRQLGRDADRVLHEQLQRFEDALSTLGDDRAARLAEDRGAYRSNLQARLRLHRARLDEAHAQRQAFTEAVASLGLSLGENDPRELSAGG